MKHFFLSLFCCCMLVQHCLGQLVLEGSVMSADGKSPVPYAHVYLKQAGVGVVSNLEGHFKLTVGQQLLPDTLVISCLGYNSHVLPVRGSLQRLEAVLIPQEELLRELTISAPPLQEQIDSAQWILGHALGRIRKLYPNHAHFYRAFYRETSSNAFKKQYLQLLEAAVHIQGFRAAAPRERLKLEVVQLRRSEDGRTFSAWEKIWSLVFGNRNELYELYQNNLVYTIARNYSNRDARLSRFLAKKHEVYLQGYTHQDGVPIYIIGYHTPYSQGFPYYEGRMWVRSDDWAIVKITETHKANPYNKTSWTSHDEFPPQRTFEFRKHRDRYYLTYAEIREMQFVDFQKNDVGKMQLKEWEYNTRMLMVSEVLTSRKDYDRIRYKSKLAEDVYLRDLEFAYDPAFWQNYNAVKLNPLDAQLQKDLEKKASLKSQFEKNGSKR